MEKILKHNIHLRRAVVVDSKQIALLAGELGYPSTAGEITNRIKSVNGDADHAVFVAEDDRSKIVGWIHVMTLVHLESGRFAEIAGLVVSENHRSLGIGRMLVNQAERWASGKGCASMTVRSNIVRTETHKFYERLGYPLIKRQKVFRKKLVAE